MDRTQGCTAHVRQLSARSIYIYILYIYINIYLYIYLFKYIYIYIYISIYIYILYLFFFISFLYISLSIIYIYIILYGRRDSRITVVIGLSTDRRGVIGASRIGHARGDCSEINVWKRTHLASLNVCLCFYLQSWLCFYDINNTRTRNTSEYRQTNCTFWYCDVLLSLGAYKALEFNSWKSGRSERHKTTRVHYESDSQGVERPNEGCRIVTL